MSHPAKKSLAVNLVNGKIVLFEKLIKLETHQFNIDVGHAFLAHDQPLVLGQPAPSFSRIVVPDVKSSCRGFWLGYAFLGWHQQPPPSSLSRIAKAISYRWALMRDAKATRIS